MYMTRDFNMVISEKLMLEYGRQGDVYDYRLQYGHV